MKLVCLLSIYVLFNHGTFAKWGTLKTIHSEKVSVKHFNRNWLDGRSDEKAAINALLSLLKKTKTGRRIVKKSEIKARETGHQLIELIDVGRTSLTDTTLLRRFNPDTPHKVSYHSRSRVYINENLSLKDALLDLAHELTHFATREGFNPYRKNFGVKDFVKSTVEGRGGEVEAYLVECRVFQELFKKSKMSNDKCHLVMEKSSGKLSLNKGKRQFYKLGRFFSQFEHRVKKHGLVQKDFGEVSDDEALFISSAYSLPYPLAAVFEYESIMAKVCANDEKRLGYLAQNRSLASENDHSLEILEHRRRCAKFTQSSHSNMR